MSAREATWSCRRRVVPAPIGGAVARGARRQSAKGSGSESAVVSRVLSALAVTAVGGGFGSLPRRACALCASRSRFRARDSDRRARRLRTHPVRPDMRPHFRPTDRRPPTCASQRAAARQRRGGSSALVGGQRCPPGRGYGRSPGRRAPSPRSRRGRARRERRPSTRAPTSRSGGHCASATMRRTVKA